MSIRRKQRVYSGVGEARLSGAVVWKARTAQQSAEPQQQQPGLMEAEAPKNAGRFITRVGFKILTGAGIEEINQVGVVRLGKSVN